MVTSMSAYENRWYDVTFEQREEKEEPDWSKIPEARRTQVQERWANNLQWERRSERWYGPQIAVLSKGRNVISIA